MAPAPTLTIEDLTVEFRSRRGVARVVDRVSLTVGKGEIVGLIGESGSGKTLTALTVLGLLPRNALVTSGAIRLSGESLLGLPPARRREMRGDRQGSSATLAWSETWVKPRK